MDPGNSVFNPDCFRNFRIAQAYREQNDNPTNSMIFSRNGDKLICSYANDQLSVYSCLTGKLETSVNCNKYGVDLLECVQEDYQIVHTSNKRDDSLRHLDIPSRKYITYFAGHTGKVLSLSSHPGQNTLLSCSVDRTLRLWDVRIPTCCQILYANSPLIGTYNYDGLIFAAGLNSQVMLYDLRRIAEDPFSIISLPRQFGGQWTRLKFSPDGRKLLINTNTSAIHVVDLFTGHVICSFKSYDNHLNLPIEASFTPDSQYVLSGSNDGRVHVWSLNRFKVCVLGVGNYEPINLLRFNEKYMMFTTAGIRTAFWMPFTSNRQKA